MQGWIKPVVNLVRYLSGVHNLHLSHRHVVINLGVYDLYCKICAVKLISLLDLNLIYSALLF